MDTQNVKSGQNGQTDVQKFKKLFNEIKKKMNLKLYENEFKELYEPEIPVNGLVFININGENSIYLVGVKTIRIVHATDRIDDIYLKLEFETGFSMISMSIIKTINIRNSVPTIKIKVE